mmetsp:Transcript_12606/g.31802  ORF Transcript_12606/g.31802 Transcript_12606/m.31802 type:complete len:214 (+) Transcript_12606:180-821(+)
MKSLGLQSVNFEVWRSSYLTALLSWGCKYVRALKVVCHSLVSVPSQQCASTSGPSCKSAKNAPMCFVAPFGSSRACVFASNPKINGTPASAACFRTAPTTGVDASPAVSPWNDARSTLRGSAPPRPARGTKKAQTSPSATGTSLASADSRRTSSAAAASAKRLFATSNSEFWSRTWSTELGARSVNRLLRPSCALKASTNAPATSCRKIMSAS